MVQHAREGRVLNTFGSAMHDAVGRLSNLFARCDPYVRLSHACTGNRVGYPVGHCLLQVNLWKHPGEEGAAFSVIAVQPDELTLSLVPGYTWIQVLVNEAHFK